VLEAARGLAAGEVDLALAEGGEPRPGQAGGELVGGEERGVAREIAEAADVRFSP
jgi:hypothetical protein